MSSPAEVLKDNRIEPVAKDLAEVMLYIKADQNLSGRRRRDLRSALKTITKALGRDDNLERLPADWRNLGKPLSAVHPAQIGLTKKRWQNVISELKFAIRHVNGQLGSVPKQRARLGSEWSRLRDLIQEPGIYRGLSRFMHFCDDQGVDPHEVDDTISESYLKHLEEASLSKSPWKLHRRTCSMWNRAVEDIFGWPRRRLRVPNYRKPSWTLSWDDFPESLRTDVDRYLAWLAGEDLILEPPDNIYKSSTLTITKRELRRLASAAVLGGSHADDIQNLEALVSKEVVTTIASYYWKDSTNSNRPYQKGLLKRLNHIARYWVSVDKDHQQWFQQLIRRWDGAQPGLTEKNRAALRQFQNTDNVKRLLSLPHRLVKQARLRKLSPRRAATLFQKAVAIEILTVAPMRIGNLARLQLGRHIVQPAGVQGPVHLVVPEDEVKNHIPLEFELPDETARLLEEYLLDHRRQLVPDDNPWLFPGIEGEHKSERTLSAQLTQIISKETGLDLTAHQFRHLAAKLHLDDHPGDYETVRRLLGHKSLRTTVEFYTGLETLAATKRYDQTILRLRGQDRDGESHA